MTIPDVTILSIDIVLLPGETMILDVCNERQKEGLYNCHLTKSELGLIYNDGTRLSKIGCLANIVALFEPKKDNHLELVVKGSLPFEIEGPSFFKRPSWQTGIRTIETYQESSADLDDLRLRLIRLMAILFRVSGSAAVGGSLAQMDINDLSYLLSGTKLLNQTQKQAVLECRSCKQRLALLIEAVEDAICRLKAIEKLGKLYQNSPHMKHLRN